jgi:plastocyanin
MDPTGGKMSHTAKISLFTCAVFLLLFDPAQAGTGEGSFSLLLPQEEVANVSIVNFDYLPPIVTAGVGELVRWINDSDNYHTVTSGTPFDPDPGSIFDSGFFGPLGSYTFAFDTAGNYDYFCTLHPRRMFGTVIVGGSGVDVALVPDDISAGALDDLAMNVAVLNFTPNALSGDLWFTVFLPDGNELVVPPEFLTPPANPLSGRLQGNDRVDGVVTLHVPPYAPSGQYRVVAKIGTYPDRVFEEDDFRFEVP